jgi:hypothetical protein
MYFISPTMFTSRAASTASGFLTYDGLFFTNEIELKPDVLDAFWRWLGDEPKPKPSATIHPAKKAKKAKKVPSKSPT